MLAEYARPWKLLTLAAGISLLVAGSFHFDAADWDIPISFIMAISTYFAAPWSLRALLDRRWKAMPGVLAATWFSIDGCYWLYWKLTDPAALTMRSANFFASLALYGICGVLWLYKGSLRELWSELSTVSRKQ